MPVCSSKVEDFRVIWFLEEMWLKAAASGKQSETKVTRLWLRPKSCYPDVIRTSFVIFSKFVEKVNETFMRTQRTFGIKVFVQNLKSQILWNMNFKTARFPSDFLNEIFVVFQNGSTTTGIENWKGVEWEKWKFTRIRGWTASSLIESNANQGELCFVFVFGQTDTVNWYSQLCSNQNLTLIQVRTSLHFTAYSVYVYTGWFLNVRSYFKWYFLYIKIPKRPMTCVLHILLSK